MLQLSLVLLVDELVRHRPLNPLRSVLVHRLDRAICLTLRDHERIHLRSQPEEFCNDAARRLILHKPNFRSVEREVGVVLRVGGRVVREVLHLARVVHIGVDVRRLHLVHQGVGVREEEACTFHILLLHHVVVKSSHFHNFSDVIG